MIDGLNGVLVKAYCSGGSYSGYCVGQGGSSWSGVDPSTGQGYGGGWGRSIGASGDGLCGSYDSGYYAPYLANGTTKTYTAKCSQGGSSSSYNCTFSPDTYSFTLTGQYKAPTVTCTNSGTSVTVSYTAGSPCTTAKLYVQISGTSKYGYVESGTTKTFTGLTAGNTYTIKGMEYLSGYPASDYCLNKEITTTVTCATPSVTLSRNSFTSFTASWGAVSGASNYTVYYGTTSSCTSSLTTSSTSYQFTGLTAGKTYYVKVVANPASAAYTTSAASTVRSVNLYNTLSAPTITLSDVTSNSITASWNSVSNSSGYTIAYGTTSACSTGSYTVTGTSKTFTELTPNTTYYFKVKANSNSASYKESSYSTVQNTTTPKIILGTPPLNYLTVVNDNQIQLSFDTVDNANQYIIEYSTNASFTDKKTLTVT